MVGRRRLAFLGSSPPPAPPVCPARVLVLVSGLVTLPLHVAVRAEFTGNTGTLLWQSSPLVASWVAKGLPNMLCSVDGVILALSWSVQDRDKS